MGLYRGIEQVTALRRETRVRALLVAAHEPAVPRDVGDENRGQLAFNAAKSMTSLGQLATQSI